MSNVIKCGYVNLHNNEKRVLDSSEFEFTELEFPKVDEIEKIDDDEIKVDENVTVRDVNRVLKERERSIELAEEELAQKEEKVIISANNRAKEIIDEAEKCADSIRQQAEDEGRESGYKEGLEKGEAQVEQMKQEWENQFLEKQKEFEEKTSGFEADFVDLASSIIENITGILVEDKKDVILHIIDRTLSNVERSNTYTIRVSREDYEYVCARKQHFQDCLKEGSIIEIIESDNLTRNKCLIETDNSVIDCSLDAQLNNLVADLKMLSRI